MGKSIYNMKLHETITIDTFLDILRVPGGWIYFTYHENGSTGILDTTTSTFVPFNNKDTY